MLTPSYQFGDNRSEHEYVRISGVTR